MPLGSPRRPSTFQPTSNCSDRLTASWRGRHGSEHERTYDIAVSGGRKIGNDGRCKEQVGNTVGEPLFLAYWKDPDFDSGQRAFYYVRVLEIPTPTWVAHDVAFFGVKAPEDAVLVHQERAYTSPIWYTP